MKSRELLLAASCALACFSTGARAVGFALVQQDAAETQRQLNDDVSAKADDIRAKADEINAKAQRIGEQVETERRLKGELQTKADDLTPVTAPVAAGSAPDPARR